MIPIYEQGGGRGIGHGMKSFLTRFDQICQEHIANNRAKAFALICYDFENIEFRRILRNEGVFAKLDRLSGNDLSIFYFHSGRRLTNENFNVKLISNLGVSEDVSLPCVVFFKLGDEGFTDVAVAQLDSADIIHGFNELYQTVESYLEGQRKKAEQRPSRIKWITGMLKFVSAEVVRDGIKAAFDHIAF